MALTDKIKMDTNMEYGRELRNFIFNVSGKLQNPVFDILLLVGIIILFKIMLKEAKK